MAETEERIPDGVTVDVERNAVVACICSDVKRPKEHIVRIDDAITPVGQTEDTFYLQQLLDVPAMQWR